MRRAVDRFVGWLAAHEPIVLVALAIVIACIWLFADVADNVLEGDTRRFDERVLLMLRNATIRRRRSDRPGWQRRTATSPRWAARRC